MMQEHARQQQTAELANVLNEAGLVAALLCQNRLVDVVVDEVAPEDFSDPLHGRLYEAILNLTANGRNASPITLFPMFQQDEDFQRVGGMGYLAGLTEKAVPIGIREHAEQIADLAARRRLIHALDGTSNAAANLSIPLPQIVDQSDAAIVAAIEKRDTWVMGTGADALDEAIARIEEIKANAGKKGCTTGIVDIDDLLGGFEPGQVIVVAGRPGMGKTAVACSSVIGLARGGSGVLFLSLEMRSKELGMRMAADLCFEGNRGVDFSKIVNGTVSSDDMMRICRARDEIAGWPIAIVDHGSVTLSRLQLGIRRAKRRFAAKGHELKVVVIDYLQLLNVDTPGRKSQYEVVSEISRTLKAMAKDLNVCIIALAQLSREVEKRDDKRPQLADLRDSGQIEQDADAVMFLYREEYYLTKKKPPKGDDARVAFEKTLADSRSRIEFLVPKCRNGPGGDRLGYYFAHYQAVRGSDNYGERML